MARRLDPDGFGSGAHECSAVNVAGFYYSSPMLRKVLHSKIHMAVATGAHPDYMGSITIDADLLEASGMRVNDVVLIGNARTGARFETYIFRGQPGSRKIEVNGAAALLVNPGDRLIILHFAWMTDDEYARHRPKVLLMDPDNTIRDTMVYEPDSPALAAAAEMLGE